MIRKLAISFFVIFAVFAAGIVVFEQSSARRDKVEVMSERLDAYAEQVLAKAPYSVFPPQLRITLIGRDGRVMDDNQVDIATMDSHKSRPEITEAIATGKGTDIRTSSSNEIPYIYYARDNGGPVIVRVAMPYDGRVQSFLKPDNAFLYFVIAFFLVGLAFIWYVWRHFSHAEQRLRHLEIRDKNRSLKRELTGNIAHELRTPVTSIRGFLEIVLGNEIDSPRAQEYLQRAYYQTLGLSDLISDMSLLTRLDEKRDGFPMTDIVVEQVLNRVKSDTSAGLKERAISFAVELPEGLTVRGNESLLYSVFRNLTDNVIAHSGTGVGISVRAARKDDGSVRFSFADNGTGVSEEHLERIFERFYRVDEGRTRDTGGSGLGLSIVRNAIALHGGEIAVRNRTPHGLEFTFTVG